MVGRFRACACSAVFHNYREAGKTRKSQSEKVLSESVDSLLRGSQIEAYKNCRVRGHFALAAVRQIFR